LVYYPLWVIRYLYRGRSFQVVVDGFSGQVLYGKAPGNTLYRAAVLVGGMGLGSLIAVDGAAAALYLLTQAEGDNAIVILGAALGLFTFGTTIMWRAYRAFRYGEQFEYRRHGKKSSPGLLATPEIFTQMKDVTEWIDQLK
jgi:hypothetical protein